MREDRGGGGREGGREREGCVYVCACVGKASLIGRL